MRVRKKLDARALIVTLILMSPSLLVGPLRRPLTVNLENGVIPPFGTVLLILFLVTSPILLALWIRSCRIGRYRRILMVETLFIILAVAVDLSSSDGEPKSLPFLLTAIPPLYLAVALRAFTGAARVKRVWLQFIITLTVYLVVNIIVWAVYFAPQQGPSPGLSYRRMGGTLAPDVLLGYLITTTLPVELYFIDTRGGKPTFADIATIFVLLLASFLTGSRGSLWFSLLSLMIWAVKGRRLSKIAFLSVLALAALLVIRMSGVEIGRFAMAQDTSRTSSWQAALVYWSRLPLLDKIVGAGWGRVYPYYDWIRNGQPTWDNQFYLGEMISIVHPHNAFIWALVEGGIAGAILFFWPFWEVVFACLIRSAGSKSKSGRFSGQNLLLWVAIALLIAFNALSSALIHTPNVALIWWFLLLSMPALFEESEQIDCREHATRVER